MATPTAIRHDAEEYKLSRAPVASPTRPPPRRVLGELTPNAKTTPKKTKSDANVKAQTTPLKSPLKQDQSVAPSDILANRDTYGPILLKRSRKRTFDHVESSDERDSPKPRFPVRPEDLSVSSASPFPSGLARPPTITILPLPDDDESNTDDDSPVSPTESDQDDAVAPIPTQEPAGSFSSLIDYDPANASDKSERANSSPPAITTPVTSHVELLKMKLRMAMYKVNTNQTLVPFSNLRLPHQRRPYGPAVPSFHETPTDHVSPARVASLDASPQRPKKQINTGVQNVIVDITVGGGPIGKLGTAPILLPTAYSSRPMGQPLPSSPPPVASPVKSSPRDSLRTPMASKRDIRLHDSPDKEDVDKSLTSSVVKGRAASGLLELMRSR